MNEGIPELGITAARADELTIINRELFTKSDQLWQFLIAVENHPELSLREKLLLVVSWPYFPKGE